MMFFITEETLWLILALTIAFKFIKQGVKKDLKRLRPLQVFSLYLYYLRYFLHCQPQKRRHALLCSGVLYSRVGSLRSHNPISQKSHLGWNLHPLIFSSILGGAPAMVFNLLDGFVFGSEFKRATEYGCLGFLKNSFASACSTTCPEYITVTVSAQLLIIITDLQLSTLAAERIGILQGAKRE